MLKSKITKADYDALEEALKPFYKESGGSYLLQSDDAEELRRSKDREAERALELEREVHRLKREKDDEADKVRRATEDAEREKARKAGDIKAIEDSLNARHAEDMKREKERGDNLERQLIDTLESGAINAMTAEISTSPSLLAPALRNRVKADLTGTKPVVKVLDANGNVTAQTLDDLKKEVVANKEFAAIIKGSSASGGGGAPNQGHGGGAPSDKKISEMTESERVALHRANPEQYREKARAEGLTVRG